MCFSCDSWHKPWSFLTQCLHPKLVTPVSPLGGTQAALRRRRSCHNLHGPMPCTFGLSCTKAVTVVAGKTTYSGLHGASARHRAPFMPTFLDLPDGVLWCCDGCCCCCDVRCCCGQRTTTDERTTTNKSKHVPDPTPSPLQTVLLVPNIQPRSPV